MTAIQYNIDNDGILTLTIDMPGQSANTMNAAFREALTETVQKVEGDAEKIAASSSPPLRIPSSLAAT